jgi:hypothetical protein
VPRVRRVGDLPGRITSNILAGPWGWAFYGVDRPLAAATRPRSGDPLPAPLSRCLTLLDAV